MEENKHVQSNSTTEYANIANPKGSRFASASLVLGILGTACGLFLFWTPLVLIGFIGGGLAILFAILSKGNRKKMEPHAKTGFIFGILAPTIATITLTLTIVSSFYILRNDESIRNATRENIIAYENVLKDIYGEEAMEEYELTYGKEFDFVNTFNQLFGE